MIAAAAAASYNSHAPNGSVLLAARSPPYSQRYIRKKPNTSVSSTANSKSTKLVNNHG